MFRLINVDTGEPVSEIVYSNPQEAVEAGKQLPVKTRIRRVVDDSWKLREAARLTDGTYQPLPDFILAVLTKQDEHFVHVFKSDPNKVAYTQTPERGMADVQTTTTLGSYLSRYEPSIPDHTVRGLVERFTKRHNDTSAVVIDYTAKAFRFAYEGQSVSHEASTSVSCMAYLASHYDCRPHHPAEAYSTGPHGLHIAYIVHPEDPKVVMSRAIVWPRDMTFVKVYGRVEADRTQLRVALEDLGYTRASSFRGALLARIPLDADEESFVMPYIDGSCQSVDDDGDNFIITSDGEYSADDTSGVIESARHSNRYTCDHCGDRYHEDSMRNVGGDLWCESCTDDHAGYCEYNDEYYPYDDLQEVIVGDCGETALWSRRPVTRYAFHCDSTNRLYSRDEFQSITVIVDSSGRTETWCGQKTVDDYFECVDCGQYFAMDLYSHHNRDGEPVCLDCAGKRREDGEFVPSHINDPNQQEIAL
jgi:hypothetical protein